MVFLLLFFMAGNLFLQAQPKSQPPTELLRKQLGIPVFDSLLLLSQVQRVILLDNVKAHMAVIKPDSIALRPLLLQMREFAEEQDNRDPELMADLVEYYNRRICFSKKSVFRQQISNLSKLHMKAKKENAD